MQLMSNSPERSNEIASTPAYNSDSLEAQVLKVAIDKGISGIYAVEGNMYFDVSLTFSGQEFLSQVLSHQNIEAARILTEAEQADKRASDQEIYLRYTATKFERVHSKTRAFIILQEAIAAEHRKRAAELLGLESDNLPRVRTLVEEIVDSVLTASK